MQKYQNQLFFYRLYEKVYIPRICKLKFDIYDYDKASRDDLIGSVLVEFNNEGYNRQGVEGKDGFTIIECQIRDKDGKDVMRKQNKQPSKLKLEFRIHH